MYRGARHLLGDLGDAQAGEGDEGGLADRLAARGEADAVVVGRGHVSLLTNSDTWRSKLVRDIGYL